MGTAIAITLAIIDSICFAAAAVYQQRAVRRTVRHRLTLRELVALPTQPGWLGGVGLATVGVSLHIVALILAPVAVVQPIGVLGVPFAVLLAAHLARQRPARATVVAIVLCVLGIGAFVWLTASRVGSDRTVSLGLLAIAVAVVLAVMAVAGVIAHFQQGWTRCLVNAVAGAFGVGMVAALMRALVQHIGTDAGRILDLHSLSLIGLMTVSGSAGGWLVQQAYASGPAEVVLASLTVVDPMIAVIVGLLLLGEGSTLSPAVAVSMILCGLVAASGVVVLARTHPQVRQREPSRNDLGMADRGRPTRIVERVW